MTNNYQIVAYANGGISLDTYGDVDISLNYQIDDILDITKRNTSWSRTITLPGTPINNKFFKGIFDVNVDTISFNPAKRVPVVVRVGTNDVMNGYMQLMNIVINNKQVDYEISIAGTFKDIMSSISDYDLGILDLSEYNHTRDQATIISSWDYNIYKNGTLTSAQGLGEGYVYPYIINGNSQDTWSKAYIYDMYPAVYLKTIIDKIFDFAGYTYTSAFFNSDYFKKLIIPYSGDKLQITEQESFDRRAVIGVDTSYPYVALTPYQNSGDDWYYNDADSWRMPLSRESGAEDDVSGEIVFTDEDNQYTVDSNGYSNHKFTCTETGYYDIRWIAKVVPRYIRSNGNDIRYQGPGNFEYNWSVKLYKASGGVPITLFSSIDPNDPNDVYGTKLFSPSDGIDHPSPWTDIGAAFDMRGVAENQLLEAGDIIRVRVGFRHPSEVNWKGLKNKMYATLLMAQSWDDGSGSEFSRLEVVPASNDSLGNDNINMNQILDTNIKMNDLFLDVIKMFNLVLQDNPNKKNDVIIEPRDDFFKSRQRVLDWDAEKKLDNDSDVKITPMSELDAKSYKFTYTKDSDYYNKEYTSETQQVYGEYEIVIDNDFSDKVNKLEIGFSPTPDASSYIDSRIAPYFLEIDGEEYKPFKVNRRILFYGGPLDLYDGSTLTLLDYPDQSAAQTTTVTRYPYCGMWDHPQNPQYDLGFGRTKKIYWDSDVVPNNNLFQMFHKQTMENIIDVNARLLECYVYLTPKDIADFDFRDIVFLLGSYWRVNKIENYNPVQTDRLTKVLLYKIIDIDVKAPNQVSIPTSNSSCPTDMISKKEKTKNGIRWITVSQSGQEVTEDCCNAVGGTYIDGVCVIRNIGPVTPTPVGPVKPVKEAFIRKGDLNVVPVSDKSGPVSLKRFGTNRNNPAVRTTGRGNYVPGGINEGLILGNNNTIAPNVKGSIVIGDGISANESGVFYLGGIKINQDGNILSNGYVVIDGGEDTVFPFDKTNFIDVIDGTYDDVRNPGGDSKARPIIDSNPNTPT